MFKKILCLIISFTVLYTTGIAVFADNTSDTGQTEADLSSENNVTDSTDDRKYTEIDEIGEIDGNSVEEKSVYIQEELHRNILDNLVYRSELEETEQFLVKITNPKVHKQIVFTSSYVFFGFIEEPGITVVIAKKNSETGEYQYYENVNGEGFWDKGGILYLNEFELEKGENDIKFIAYKNTEVEQLESGINLQVNYFSITFLEETIKNMIINSTCGDIIKLFQQYNNLTNNDMLFNFSETNE